jgi:hypothetical protein
MDKDISSLKIYEYLLSDLMMPVKKYKINIVGKKRCFESFYQLRFWSLGSLYYAFIFVSSEKLL